MKILDTPRTGSLGRIVAFQSRYGLCLRERICPRNIRTLAREFMRTAFGHHSRAFSHKLTEEQQDRWALAAAQVMSNPTLGQDGPLTAQQLRTGINSVRSRVNAPETLEPPAPLVFGPSPVGQLVIENSGAGIRLLLRVEGDLSEDVMVFGQEPCNSGRRKRRNVAYLGLLPPPIAGWSDITYLYRARYGEPRPNQRVFIVTCQQKDDWKAQDTKLTPWSPNRPNPSRPPRTHPIARFAICTRGAHRLPNGSTGHPPANHPPMTGQNQGEAATKGTTTSSQQLPMAGAEARKVGKKPPARDLVWTRLQSALSAGFLICLSFWAAGLLV